MQTIRCCRSEYALETGVRSLENVRVQYAYGAVDMHSVRMAYVFDVHAKYI